MFIMVSNAFLTAVTRRDVITAAISSNLGMVKFDNGASRDFDATNEVCINPLD